MASRDRPSVRLSARVGVARPQASPRTFRLLFIETRDRRFYPLVDLLSRIESQRYVIDRVDDAARARALLAKNAHDLCLVDSALGAKACIDLVLTASESARAPVLVLAEPAEQKFLRDARIAGAVGYICLRHLSSATLERAIRTLVKRRAAGGAPGSREWRTPETRPTQPPA